MGLLKTPLMVPPSGALATLGEGIHHTVLIKGLRRCNGTLTIPDPSTWVGWYPGRASGMTSIWWGQPPLAPKICAFHLGEIPEFTQITPEGTLLRRGWRDIFKRVINIGAVSQHALERQFKVRLDTDGVDTKLCHKCRLDGQIVPAGLDGLCASHHEVKLISEHEEMLKRERRLKASWL